MRLSDEQIKKLQENFEDNIKDFGENNVVASSGLIKNFLDTIEALQQENEQLKDENASIRNWNACEEKLHKDLLESDKRRIELELELEGAEDYREGLEAIIEQLRAQVAAMKTAICNMCRGKECDNCAFGDANITETIKHWRPERVCLCGSTRFFRAFDDWNFRFTLEGKIVLTIGCNTKSDKGLGLTDEDKIKLDELHKRKIDLADWIFVIDVGGYIGSSTQSEIEYAELHGKPIKYLSKEFPDYQEPAEYHNPADVEALIKAREALKWIMRDTGEDDIRARATEALAEIDKVIGGKEDE